MSHGLPSEPRSVAERAGAGVATRGRPVRRGAPLLDSAGARRGRRRRRRPRHLHLPRPRRARARGLARAARGGAVREEPPGDRLRGGLPDQRPRGVELRDVVEVLDAFPPFTPRLVELLRWAEEYYLVPPGELLRAALPPGLNARGGAAAPARRGVEYAAPGSGSRRGRGGAGRARPRSARCSSTSWRAGASRWRSCAPPSRAAAPRSPRSPGAAWCGSSRDAGGARRRARRLGAARPRSRRRRPRRSPRSTARAGASTPFLLHGVTGSGKTEVYLQAIAARARPRPGALVLVPEIALTPQLAGRFRARFGDDVALLHSGLSGAERHDEWLRLRRGEAHIAWASRSAIFAPVADLGVHRRGRGARRRASSRRTGPRYHARDLAVVRAKREGAVVRPRLGDPVARDARERAPRPLPHARAARPASTPAAARGRARRPVAPARGRARSRRPDSLSPQLVDALEETLAAGQQAIVFLNRRGYQTLVRVRGVRRRGPLHRVRGLAHRTTSGAASCSATTAGERADGRALPACGGVRLGVGVGTEQVEEAVRALLPARAGRAARSRLVASADDTAAVLARFARREVDVLVGTQMVTKGHDFPGVTLVGVVLADTALALPDFRAARADLPAADAGGGPRRARRRRGARADPDLQPGARPPSRWPSPRLRRLRGGGARAPATLG